MRPQDWIVEGLEYDGQRSPQGGDLCSPSLVSLGVGEAETCGRQVARDWIENPGPTGSALLLVAHSGALRYFGPAHSVWFGFSRTQTTSGLP